MTMPARHRMFTRVCLCPDCCKGVRYYNDVDHVCPYCGACLPALHEKPPLTLCPQCGPMVASDEDGRCVGCGATCTGAGVDQAIAAIAAQLRAGVGPKYDPCEDNMGWRQEIMAAFPPKEKT